MIRVRVLLTSLALACCLAPGVRAGSVSLPGGAEGERLGERFRREAPSLPQPSATTHTRDTVPAPPGTERVRLHLRETVLRGLSVYSLSELEQELAGSGTPTSLADLYRFADRLTRRYWDDGYILARVRLAAYDVRNGKAVFDVSEGRLAKVVLDDDHRPPIGMAVEVVSRLREEKLFHLPTVERYLLALNDLDGVAAGIVLEAAEEPGSVNVIVRVRQKEERSEPWAATLDNLGSRYLGPFQVGLSHRFRSLATDGGRLDVAAFGSLPLDEVRFASAAYAEPVSARGTTVELSASRGNTAPGYLLTSREIEGSSSTVGFKLSEPVVRTRRERVTLSSQLVFKQVHTTVLGQTIADDRIRVAEAELVYDGYDRAGGLIAGAVRVSKGFDILGATETGSPNLSRADGRSDFLKVSGSLTRTQSLGSLFAAAVAASGQYTPAPLLSSEEFGFGGQAAGRGYDPSEFTGDRGVSATVELRYLGLPDSGPWVFQPFAFYDIGKVWDIDQGAHSGASAGVGVRFQFDQQVYGSVYVAEPLTAPVADPPGGNGKNPRVLFSVTRSF